ncbi:cobalt-precorrin-6A reductase [uncultured Tessaracoccus sp.]|uniref:cobalt-precorrin-6A reductase n=1 Tax=uncultured Tessaracoccus sp. TaxID=905023 RepID=UPI002638E9F9|nr:cobalt-precorrin-6A reductase [uncultured Tessaracoccus sp.]
MRILVLGGTAEGRAIAAAAVDAGLDVVSSLAGRTKQPVVPAGAVRVGGFGGAEGLAQYLRDKDIRAVVNATHPFAAQMARNAVAASEATGVPLIRLLRPSWAERDADWDWVSSHAEAAVVAAANGGAVFLTVGRQHSLEYADALAEHDVVCRVAFAGNLPWPPQWHVLETRGPFTLEEERALLREHRIGVLVTKDAGGDHTAAKLDAARELGVQVVMLRRPDVEGDVVSSVDEAAGWLSVVTRRGA